VSNCRAAEGERLTREGLGGQSLLLDSEHTTRKKGVQKPGRGTRAISKSRGGLKIRRKIKRTRRG